MRDVPRRLVRDLPHQVDAVDTCGEDEDRRHTEAAPGHPLGLLVRFEGGGRQHLDKNNEVCVCVCVCVEGKSGVWRGRVAGR